MTLVAQRVRALLNPSAGSGRARRALRDWSRAPEGEACEWIVSKSAAHLQALVRIAQDDDLDALLLAGGDGTVALAADALRGVTQRVPLAILPTGSGNDFARDLGLVGRYATPWGLLAAGSPRWVDLAEALPGGARYGCVASIGFDTRALEIIHGSRLPRSKLLNVYASLRALWSEPAAELRVSWEGGCFEGRAMLAAVTNTRGYGGGFLLSPRARLDDGLLDLCLVGDLGRGRLLREFPRIFQGSHGQTAGVVMAQSPWVRIEPLAGPLPYCLDGEPPSGARATRDEPLELRCVPRALLVLAPGEVAA